MYEVIVSRTGEKDLVVTRVNMFPHMNNEEKHFGICGMINGEYAYHKIPNHNVNAISIFVIPEKKDDTSLQVVPQNSSEG